MVDIEELGKYIINKKAEAPQKIKNEQKKLEKQRLDLGSPNAENKKEIFKIATLETKLLYDSLNIDSPEFFQKTTREFMDENNILSEDDYSKLSLEKYCVLMNIEYPFEESGFSKFYAENFDNESKNYLENSKMDLEDFVEEQLRIKYEELPEKGILDY